MFLRSLSGQIIALLVLALLCSQVLNTYFLIGDRKAVVREQHYTAVIEHMVEAAQNLPKLEGLWLPYVISDRAAFQGTIFLSQYQRSHFVANASPADRYAAQLAARLAAVGQPASEVSAVFHAIGDAPADSRPPPRADGHSPPHGGLPPQHRGGRPPPSASRGFFHPNRPPVAGGQPAPGLEEIVFSAKLAPGIWLNALAPHYSTEAISIRALISTSLIFFGAAIGAVLLARHITRPIRSLTAAAEALGRGGSARAVESSGPQDVRVAARAFNDMQQRLTRLIDTQRSTLRALGHDLRTPITSMRLRAESFPDSEERTRFIASLEELAVTVEEILSWAKDATAEETLAPVDLLTLLDTIAQDYVDQGSDVRFSSELSSLVTPCRRQGLRRAISNLVDNALKYGHRSAISVERRNGSVLVHVDDDGPGIADDMLTEVTNPFTRLESSRSRTTGGIGLGLSIVESIVQANGGRLELANRQSGGLRATIHLQRPKVAPIQFETE